MELIKNNKIAFGGAGVAALGILAWLAFGFFGIQTAFIDDVVDEGGPVFAAPAEQVQSTGTGIEDAETEEIVPEAIASQDDEAESAEAPAAEADEPAADTPPADATADDPPAEQTDAPDAIASADDPATEEAASEPAEEPAPELDPEPAPVEERAAPGEIVTIGSGNFVGINNYAVTGDALVLNNGTEQRFLRFENFASDNGPDLKVYLRAANGDFISLGDLSGNVGDQNYEIPVDVDLEVFNQVEIWCERFARGFGEATINAG